MSGTYAFATLPDLLAPDLALAFVGINPSTYSVERGHYFARRTSRFWPAFSRSRLSAPIRAALGVDVLGPEHDAGLLRFGIGFTDVIKRPSSNASSLAAQDFEEWVPRLEARLRRYRVRVACFHGLTGYRPFAQIALGLEKQAAKAAALGPQPSTLGGTRLFVVPNPSPANAHVTPADQAAWYDRLAEFLDQVRSPKSEVRSPKSEAGGLQVLPPSPSNHPARSDQWRERAPRRGWEPWPRRRRSLNMVLTRERPGAAPIEREPAYTLIDCDVHQSIKDYRDLQQFMPQAWRRYVGPRGFGGPSSGYLTSVGLYRKDVAPPSGGEPGTDPAWLRHQLMERYHVAHAILNGGGILGLCALPDADFACALATAYNEWLMQTWLGDDNPDGRFKGSMLVAPQDPEEAAKEIRRVAGRPERKHIAQVMFAAATTAPMGQKPFHPIYAAAEECGLPVAVHPGVEGRSIAGAPTAAGWVSKYIEWHTCLPQQAMTHAVSLVCQGVFVKYPRLKVVFVECGIGWFPHVMWRLDRNYKSLRQEVPWLTRLPSEYMREHFRLTTQPIEEPPSAEQFLDLLEMMDAQRTLMFSSDYPHWDFDDPVAAFKDVPEPLKRRIFHDTAAELYGL